MSSSLQGIKRNFYVFMFTVLGIMFGFLIKEVIQIIYLNLLLGDFNKYSFGLNWNDLTAVNFIFSALLLVVCGFWGWAAGKYWWRQIYVLRNDKKRWHNFLR